MADVLLIEPDKLLADTYMGALQSVGIVSERETSAQEAINCIDNNEPKLVILELQLARHNGVEFLYELRSHSDWQHIPILLHTIVPENELGMTKQGREHLGIAEYLYKPQTSLKKLIEVVQEICEKNKP